MTALDQIKSLLGPKGYLDSPGDMAPYVTDWRGRHTGKAALVALPKTTEDVSKLAAICYQNDLPMVPQGGNTGLVQGGVPGTSGAEIVISLKRMNRILDIDPENHSATVEAGVVLEALQTAAADKDRLFPLSLGAEGSCMIGGNIATNAGGIHVMRYGPMRDLVLGLEAVLPTGEVWNGLRSLRKDNTGFDIKQLFIGSEGTLGIITKATLKLFPLPKTVETVIAAAPGPDALLKILGRTREAFGGRLAAFEIFPRTAMEMVVTHIPKARDPFARPHPWYGIVEFWDPASDPTLRGEVEGHFAAMIENGPVHDAVVASSEAQRKDIWRLRETIAEAQKADGDGIKHDISVPVGKIPEFLERADAAVERIIPGFKRIGFGHMGDGNIHYDPCPPPGMDQKTFLGFRDKVNRAVHDIVADLGGSISAEHGIGSTRLKELAHYKPDLDIALYRKLKQAFDPKGLMNPGKLVP